MLQRNRVRLTSGMNAHLHTMHPDIGKATESSQPKLPSVSIGANRPGSERQQKILTDMLLDIRSENLSPMVFIESSSLLRFLKFVEPEFKLPYRQTTTLRLLAKDALSARIKDDMSTRAIDIAITTDIWTSITNEDHMSFTASYLTPQWINMNVVLDSINICKWHTLEHILTKLGEIARIWNISKKIVACMHDGTSNCKEAGTVNS